MMNFWKLFLLWIVGTIAMNAGIYETLDYGDTKEVVTEKLHQCERIESQAEETMFGRNVALNGNFHIKKPLGELQLSLYFGWTEEGGLKEITLRSGDVEEVDYYTKLASAFEEALVIIQEVYGKPIVAQDMPASDRISEGVIISSHLWHVEEGSLLLGVAKKDGKYQLSIRYTQKRIEPVEQ